MSDNTLVAIAIIAFAVMIHGCASCEKSRNHDDHELSMERLRIEHSKTP